MQGARIIEKECVVCASLEVWNCRKIQSQEKKGIFLVKVTEHSFRAVSGVVQKPARLSKSNKHCKSKTNVETKFYTLFVFERNEPEQTSSNRPRNPVKCSACAIAWKIETDCLRRNLPISTIQSLEFQEIWSKNSLEIMWMIYHEKAEFWHREFLILQKTIYGELRKSPMSKFY